MWAPVFLLAIVSSLAQVSIAVPTLTETSPELDARQLLGIDNVVNDSSSRFASITATAVPTSLPSAISALSAIAAAAPTPANFIGFGADLLAAGLTTDNVNDLLEFAQDAVGGENSFNNNNPRNPRPAAFPRAGTQDAPYSIPESQLRGAIHIPSSFKYGARGAPNPIILVPGTGSTGYIAFQGNYIPVLTGSNIADPIWLNIPGFQLNDAQANAEYVAYAINYIHGISNNRQVSVAGWSQGSLSSQWALKYWPSTRAPVTDLITFSADCAGTINANFIATPGLPLPPSILQQQAGSNFIRTLRSNGGDSAFVPTTNIYSGFFDEIVQPQTGPGASAVLKSTRSNAATNAEVQKICPGQPAGSLYTHAGVLHNPIGFALLVDALRHPGPGQVSRIRGQLSTLCTQYLTPGLDLSDLLLTQNSILVAGVTLVTYPRPVIQEPAIKNYARR